ncbi:MAG: hypothetical protein CM15mV26_0020 [uncultured marine virus]|nr:MAG: hypothetical protein CM15mV26_0020 [uncultured marine virus]
MKKGVDVSLASAEVVNWKGMYSVAVEIALKDFT